MTLVTAVLDRVARQCSLDTPDSWVSATDAEYVEIRDDFLLETVDDILERIDLPSPIGKQYTLTGDGSETYSLPSDFKRLQRDEFAVYETTTVRRAMLPVTDDGVWTMLQELGSTGAERYYKIEGYEGNWTISIYREPAASINVIISYVSTLWMADSGGTAGSTFTDSDDVVLLPRRLLEAGTVARWRSRKGLDATEKWAEYEMELTKLSNDRRSRFKVSLGEPKRLRSPYDIPVPDHIPTS